LQFGRCVTYPFSGPEAMIRTASQRTSVTRLVSWSWVADARQEVDIVAEVGFSGERWSAGQAQAVTACVRLQESQDAQVK